LAGIGWKIEVVAESESKRISHPHVPIVYFPRLFSGSIGDTGEILGMGWEGN